MRKTHRTREDLKGDGSRGESGGEGRRNAGLTTIRCRYTTRQGLQWNSSNR